MRTIVAIFWFVAGYRFASVAKQVGIQVLNDPALAIYRKQFVDIGFERTSLFAALRNRYGSSEVLYPGSSVHITPSLYFPHVVYVDYSPDAVNFFSNLGPIHTFVQRNKHYRRRAHIRLIAQDFTNPLSDVCGRFDLLLSLYTEGVAKQCKQYLKPGGLFVTNNHPNEIEDVLHDSALELISVLRLGRGEAKFVDSNLEMVLARIRKKIRGHNYLQTTNKGLMYRESIDDYLIFKRDNRADRE